MEATTLITPLLLTAFIFVFFASNNRKKPEECSFSVGKRISVSSEQTSDLNDVVIQTLKKNEGIAKYRELIKDTDGSIKLSGYVGTRLSPFDATIMTKQDQGAAKLLIEGNLIPSLLVYILVMGIALFFAILFLVAGTFVIGFVGAIVLALLVLIGFSYLLFTLQKTLKKRLVEQLNTVLEKLEYTL